MTLFQTIEDFYANNKVLRANATKVSNSARNVAKSELNLILKLYEAYLKTPPEFIDEGVRKYKINIGKRTIGCVFLLVVLGSNTFVSKSQKWDSKRYGQWAKILTYWIETGKTYQQAVEKCQEKSKSAIIDEYSNNGVVGDATYKKTIKEFRTIHKVQFRQSDYLLYIDLEGNITQLPKEAIELLIVNNFIS